MARSKIASVPDPFFDEFNHRLERRERPRELAQWLNALPEVQAMLAKYFGGVPISDQNISDWRKDGGGFDEWCGKRNRIEHIKELSNHAARLAKANGGNIAEAASAIASGKILELLEACDGKLDPETISDIVGSLASLRGAEIAQQRVDLEGEKLKRKDQEIQLEREKFRRTTCELFLQWRDDERARNIADGPGTNDEKIEQLGQAMFGELWDTEKK